MQTHNNRALEEARRTMAREAARLRRKRRELTSLLTTRRRPWWLLIALALSAALIAAGLAGCGGAPPRASIVIGTVAHDDGKTVVTVIAVNQGETDLAVSTGDFILVDQAGVTYTDRTPVARVAKAQEAVPVELSATLPVDRHLVAVVATLPGVAPITLKIEQGGDTR